MSEEKDNYYIVASYKKDGQEVFIEAIGFLENMGFNSGNFIKYLIRYKNKDGINDLKKALYYLDRTFQSDFIQEHRNFVKEMLQVFSFNSSLNQIEGIRIRHNFYDLHLFLDDQDLGFKDKTWYKRVRKYVKNLILEEG